MRSVLAPIGALVAAAPLVAQVTSIPETGTRVRVESSAIIGRTALGTMIGMNQGLVTLGIGKRGTRLVIPWSRINSVSVVTGRNKARGAALGALIGGSALLVMYPYADPDPFDPLSDPKPNSTHVAAALSLPVIGAIIGSRRGPEVWESLAWRPASDTVLLEGEAVRLDLVQNSRLLVRHNNRWVKGRLVSDNAETLTIDARGRRELSWSGISQVNVQESRSRLRGVVLGMTLGGAYGLIRVLNTREATISKRQQVIGVSVGAGAALGALIGRGSWTRIPIPAR